MKTKSRGSKELHFTKFLAASLGLAVTGVATQSALAQDWTAAVDDDYNNPFNWQGDVFPEAINATINLADPTFFPVLTADPMFTPVDIFVGTGAGLAGRLDQSAGTLSTGTDNWMFVGINGATGTYNQTGSANLSAGAMNVGAWSDQVGATGVWNMDTSGTSTFNAGARGGGVGDASVLVGENMNNVGTLNFDNGTIDAQLSAKFGLNGGNGTLNMTGGTFNTTGEVWFGGAANAGTGTATQSGGTMSSTSWFVIGRSNTNVGVYNLQGGTLNAATTAGAATLASFQGATGTLNVSGGTLNSTFGGGTNGASLVVGEGGTGTLNVSGTGLVNTAATTMAIAIGATGVGTVNLNGGTIQTGGVTAGNGMSTFNFNGGTLRATQSNVAYMTNLTAANVQAGGAVIDTNGFDITIAQALLDGGGGLMKLGTGKLTLTGMNTYMGDTSIFNGTLSITTGYLADGANVGLMTGSIFDLNFMGTDTVNALIVDGAPQETGTWGAIGSGADHESALFTGTGLLNVTSAVPEPGTLMLVLGGGASMLLLARRRNRRG